MDLVTRSSYTCSVTDNISITLWIGSPFIAFDRESYITRGFIMDTFNHDDYEFLKQGVNEEGFDGDIVVKNLQQEVNKCKQLSSQNLRPELSSQNLLPELENNYIEAYIDIFNQQCEITIHSFSLLLND